MIKITIERDGWYDYKENAWGGAISTLDEIEAQGKENEAVEIIEEYMSDIPGYIPSEIEVNDFIWFDLPDVMHLYDNEDDDDDDDDDEDDEEFEDDEEE